MKKIITIVILLTTYILGNSYKSFTSDFFNEYKKHSENIKVTKENASIVITHYQRLLDYIVPDFVHVLYKGRIVKSGGKELALELEEKGYDWIKQSNLK